MDRKNLQFNVQAAIKGDTKAFNNLAEAVKSMGEKYAFSILREEDLAQDAVQEALLDSYMQLKKLKTPEAFPEWFKRIVFKQCDRIRRRKEFNMIFLEDIQVNDRSNPSEILIQNEVKSRIEKSVNSLSAADRTIARLRFFNETSYQEISVILSISEDTVKNRLRTIRKKMRSDLRDLRDSDFSSVNTAGVKLCAA